MKNDVILACKYIIRHTIFNVQACYSEKINNPDKSVAEFEENAYNLIKKATEYEIEEAYDECLDCVSEEHEITAMMVLCTIGNRAETPYSSIAIESINIIKEL